MNKNTELSTQGEEFSLKNSAVEAAATPEGEQSSAGAKTEHENDLNKDEASGKSEPCVQKSTLEIQIERDFNAFSRAYPNISRELLLNDESFTSYARYMSEQPLSQVYRDYKALCDQIELKIMHSLSATRSSVGALSDATSANDGYFTKEQVQRMSTQEIKRNFEQIRRSQERW